MVPPGEVQVTGARMNLAEYGRGQGAGASMETSLGGVEVGEAPSVPVTSQSRNTT